jgi:predicted alpha/beta hydrolase
LEAITEYPIRYDLNWYTYANNNPVMFIDPSGLLFKKLVSTVTNAVTSTASAVVNAATTVANAVVTTVATVVPAVVNAAVVVVDTAIAIVDSAVSVVSNAVTAATTAVINCVTENIGVAVIANVNRADGNDYYFFGHEYGASLSAIIGDTDKPATLFVTNASSPWKLKNNRC